MDAGYLTGLLPLLFGWVADKIWGDPPALPHPVVGFGKLIAAGEKRLNGGKYGKRNGAYLALGLVVGIFLLVTALQKGLQWLHPVAAAVFAAFMIFYGLAGTTLIKEVEGVFGALLISVEQGRKQVARVVGRDTETLSPQQIRTAALETLSENLSDGVVAPLFWYMLLDVPGMLAYKMVNTLDSMIGYKNDRYRQFGCWAARMDDVANYLPARITALLILLVSNKLGRLRFVAKFARHHTSPNAGYPEAALAAVLDCRFGGPGHYFGKKVEKPYIGDNDRAITHDDLQKAVAVNRKTEIAMVAIVLSVRAIVAYALMSLCPVL